MFAQPYRVHFVVAIAAGAVVIAGCSSSAPKQADTSTPSASSSTPASLTPAAGTSSSAGAATLSKAQFISQANALCTDTYAKVHAIPTPSGPTDYPTIAAYARAVLTLFPPFSSRAKALVAQSADADQLTAKWIALDESDFTAQKPVLQQLLTAASAKQAAQTQQLADQLGNASDHSAAVAAFLSGYGLTECAKLESS